jgi:DNA-binding HxlR family transcriptional regulator
MTEDSVVREIPPCGCSAPGVAAPALCYCGVEHLLRIIRRRYSLAVLHAIHRQQPAQYHHIARAVPRASSSTLAETLDALGTARLLDRHPPGGASGQPLYSLTPSGTKLLRRLRPLLEDVQDAEG